MADTEFSTCCTCGQSWKTGTDGSHSCSARLFKTVEKLQQQLRDKDALIVEYEKKVDALLAFADMRAKREFNGRFK